MALPEILKEKFQVEEKGYKMETQILEKEGRASAMVIICVNIISLVSCKLHFPQTPFPRVQVQVEQERTLLSEGFSTVMCGNRGKKKLRFGF